MRCSGILMHITSLPGPYGIGSMGKEAVKSNMVYRLCNNMVYTFALGSSSKRYALLRV